MPLQKQNIPIGLGVGVDTKTDPKVVQPGKLLACENGIFTKIGTITKRFGFDDLPKTILGSSAVINGSKKLATFKDELLQLTSQDTYSFVESSDTWANKGKVGSVSVESVSVVKNTAAQSTPDVNTTNGVTVYAWEDSRGGVRATVIDQASGLPLQSDVSLSATGLRPRVSSAHDYIYVHYMDAASTFKVQRLNPASPLTFEAAVTIQSDANATNPNFDITPIGTNLACAYETTGNVIKVGYLKTSGEFGTTVEGFPNAVTTTQSGSGCIGLATHFLGDSNDAIYVFYHNTTNGLRCAIYPLDLTTPTVVTMDTILTQVNQIGALEDNGTAYIWYEVNAAATYNYRIKANSVTRAGTVASGTGTEHVRSVGLVSKPIKEADGNFYYVVCHESTLQPTYFTMKYITASRGFIVNSFAKLASGGVLTKRSTLTNLAEVEDSVYAYAARVKTQLISDAGTVYTRVGLNSTSISFDDSRLFNSKTLGDNLHISGGLLQNYDGTSVTEHGFNVFPENISNSITGGAGTITAGTRLYQVVYEWTDQQGQIHQSAPSVSLSVTNILNDRNTLTIPTLRITEKKSASGRTDVSIAIYRTIASGSIFYRVSSITSPTLNDVTVDSITFNDGTPDASITSNQVIYTSGGVLDNDQPPSCKVIEEYRNRLAIAGLEDENLIQLSKERVPGEGVSFSDAIQIRCDQGDGGIEALQTLDDKLIIFKKDSLYLTAGDGPTDAGTNNDYLIPQVIATDVGTSDPQSVVRMPLGLMFKSEKGYYLLGRSLQLEYKGAPVEAFNDLTVTGAVLKAEKNQVIFTHSDGQAVIYDYYFDQWSTATGHESLSSANWKSTYVFMKDDGVVYKESATSYFDAGATVSTKLITPWISAAQLQGSERLYKILLLGELKSQHKLKVTIQYNFVPTDYESFVYDSETIFGSNYYGEDAYYGASSYYGGVDGLYQVELRPALQKCESFRLVILDLNPEQVEGAGFTLVSMLCEVGVRAGTFRQAMTKRASPQ